jgi:hypothetical protein
VVLQFAVFKIWRQAPSCRRLFTVALLVWNHVFLSVPEIILTKNTYSLGQINKAVSLTHGACLLCTYMQCVVKREWI